MPFSSFISLLVPREHLGHYSDKRKYLPSNLVKEFAKKIYNENGIGITIQDIINEYGLDKKKAAQRKMKHLLEHKILFTAIDLEKEGIKIRGIKRENPQRYYPSDYKPKIIERTIIIICLEVWPSII